MQTRARIGLFLGALALVGCDHATKMGAVHYLRETPQSIVPGVLQLTYAENPDVAFSLMRTLGVPHPGWLMSGVALMGTVLVMAWWWKRRSAPIAEQAAYALILAGALGNGIERAVRGYVVDFIHVRHWPVFNVADIVIVLGVGLLLLTRSRAPKPSAA